MHAWSARPAFFGVLLLAACGPAEARPPPGHPGPRSPATLDGHDPGRSNPGPAAAEPDGDSDGVPDRCDACPFEPGPLWDSYPAIDGCSTAAFHSLVREPEGLIVRVEYPLGAAEPPPPAQLAGVIEIFKDARIDSIALAGHAAASEPKAEALARERARRLGEALKAGGVQAGITVYTAPAGAPSVEIAALSRDGQEELRWADGRFEHVRAAAAREKKARAQGAPSPCGRLTPSPGGQEKMPL